MNSFPNKLTKQTLQAIPDAVVAVGQDGTVLFLNTAAEVLTGYVNDELTGLRVETLVPASRRTTHSGQRERFQSAPLARSMGAARDLQLLRKDGSLVPVEISLSPLSGYGVGVTLSTIRDASEQERRSKEDIFLAEIGRIVNSDREIRNVYQAVADLVPSLIPFDRLVITLRQPDSELVLRAFVCGVHVDGGEAGTEVISATDTGVAPGPYAATSLAGLLIRGEPLVDAMESVGLSSFVEAPLGDTDNPFGYLSLRSTENDAYDYADVSLLERITAQISPAIENARLYDQAQKDAHEKAVLAEISRIITSTSEIEAVYDRTSEQIRELVPFDRIVISTFDRDRNLVTDRYVAGLEVQGGQAGSTYQLDDSATGELIQDRRPRWFSEVEVNRLASRYPEVKVRQNAGLRSMVIAPLIWDDQPIGILILRSKAESTYGEPDALTAMKIANQISGAVANSEMVTTLLRENEEKLALAEISRVVNSDLDVDAVYETVAREVMRLIPHDRMAILSIDHDANLLRREFVSGRRVRGAEVGTTIEVTSGVTEIGSVGHESAIGIYTSEIQRNAVKNSIGPGSSMRAPLTFGSERFGYLNVENAGGEPFHHHHLALIESVAVVIAPAIENARLYEASRREASERAALAEIGRVINSSADVHAVYGQFAAVLLSVLAADFIAVSLITPDREQYKHEFVWENGKLGPLFSGELPISGTSIEETVGLRKSVLISSETTSDIARRFPLMRKSFEKGVNSGIGVPLIASDNVIGVLGIGSGIVDAYSWSDVEKLERIAAQIAGAIANAQTHTRALESERARIETEAKNRELILVEEQRSGFLSTVSHELKTPLTSLIAFADILSRNQDSRMTDRQLQQISIMQRSARRLDLLIDDLLDVSRLDAGTFKLARSEFEVTALIEELKAAFLPLIDSSNQSLTVSYPDRDFWIEADRDRVAQVITNLLSNASKYSLPETEIELALKESGDAIVISVADSGIGMSQETQDNLFTAFYRATDEHTQSQPGSGLGLVIVKSIVDLHYGTITVSSKQRVGTIIEVTLPNSRRQPSESYLEAERAGPEPVLPRSRLE
ncbi:MAG: GAF domain-containing protein [Chloroflexi bacterium]|nr:GAF domain-containing protein [Chloroflexota bacterium]